MPRGKVYFTERGTCCRKLDAGKLDVSRLEWNRRRLHTEGKRHSLTEARKSKEDGSSNAFVDLHAGCQGQGQEGRSQRRTNLALVIKRIVNSVALSTLVPSAIVRLTAPRPSLLSLTGDRRACGDRQRERTTLSRARPKHESEPVSSADILRLWVVRVTFLVSAVARCDGGRTWPWPSASQCFRFVCNARQKEGENSHLDIYCNTLMLYSYSSRVMVVVKRCIFSLLEYASVHQNLTRGRLVIIHTFTHVFYIHT